MEISPVGTNFKDTDFVVYGFLRKDYSSFYYIGKGRPDRPYKRSNRTIPHPSCRSRVVILYSDVTEEVALSNEKILINLMGRIGVDPHGTLRNIRSGGVGLSAAHYKKGVKRSKKPPRPHTFQKNWFHSLIGEVEGLTSRELAKKFPEQSLRVKDLNLVGRGKRDFYKGWRLVENVVLPTGGSFPVVRDWYHPDFGEVYSKTLKEIAEMDGRGMKIGTLRHVGLGTTVAHMGWRLLKNRYLPYRGKRHNWQHPEHGVVKNQTCRDMADKYGLVLKNIQQVACASKFSCRGWTLLCNHDRKPDYNNQPKLLNWHHPVYGTMDNCCAGDVARMFPEQFLDKSSLRRIGKNPGKYSYRGWKAEVCKTL